MLQKHQQGLTSLLAIIGEIDLHQLQKPETLQRIKQWESYAISLGILTEIGVVCLVLLDSEAEQLEGILVIGGFLLVLMGGLSLFLTDLYREQVLQKENKTL